MKTPKLGEKILVPMTITDIDKERVSVSRFGVTWHLYWKNVYPLKRKAMKMRAVRERAS